MSSLRDKISKGLDEIGACWCVSSDKYVDTYSLQDQIEGRKTYHIHPDRSYPYQSNVKKFDTLEQLWQWIQIVKRAGPDDEIIWTGSGYDFVK